MRTATITTSTLVALNQLPNRYESAAIVASVESEKTSSATAKVRRLAGILVKARATMRRITADPHLQVLSDLSR